MTAHPEDRLPVDRQQAITLIPDDLSLDPRRFAGGEEPMDFVGGWIWAFGDNPNEPPVHFQRGWDGSVGLHGGDIQMGVGPLTPNTVLPHTQEIYPSGHPLPYLKVEGDPEGVSGDEYTWQMSSDDPGVLLRFSTRRIHFVEEGYTDLTFDYFPFAFFLRENMFGGPYLVQVAEVKGTYAGEEVTFLGGMDRTYNNVGWDFIVDKRTFAIWMIFAGIHPDGVREWGYVYKGPLHSGGFYCKDGEEPVISDELDADLAWTPLPYADDDAHVLDHGTFAFGGKVIHYTPKWGWRGHDEKYINGGPCGIPGFGQTSGIWYEGAEPYEFERVFTYNEAYNAVPGNI